MDQMRAGPVLLECAAINLETEVQNATELSDHLRDLAKRDRHENDWPDGAQLQLNAVKELLSSLPEVTLSTRADRLSEGGMNHAGSEKIMEKGDISETSLSSIGRQEQLSPRLPGMLAAIAEAEVPNSPTSHLPSVHDNQSDGATASDQDDAISEEWVSVADNSVPNSRITSLPQAWLRESQTMSSREPGDVLRHTLFAANMSAPDSALESGLRYSFHSWGKQHTVRITSIWDANSRSLLSFPSLTLHPSSSLVEQRLQIYDDATDRGDRWTLSKYDDQQKQHKNHHRCEQSEDDI